MPGGDLPEGLVTANNETVSEEIGNVDRVDLEDVARLWRDYSTSRALLHDGTGERLANFFWRIWSNPAISNSVPGSTIARLFMTISEGGNRVRTTPVPSPRSTSPRSTSPASRNTTPTPSSPQTVAERISASDTIGVPPLTQSSPQETADPVLDMTDSSGSSTRASPSLKNDESIPDPAPPRDRSPTRDTDPMSPTSPTSPVDRKLSNGSKKRAAFVTASGARAKTRPSLPRRKTSQGSSSGNPEPKRSPIMPTRNSPLRSPSLKQNQAEPTTTTTTAVGAPPIEPPPGLPSIPSTTTSFALPSLSWKDVSSPASSHRGPPSTAATSQQPSSWLVDTNFRVKFVENQIRGASSTNLAALGKSTSTVRFADQLPGRRATSGATDKHAPPAAAPSTTRDGVITDVQGRPRRGSGAIADDDDDEEDIVPLPRTKSQLSMMIEQERRRSGTHELRPSPLQHQLRRGGGEQQSKLSKPDDNDGEDVDDDLLTMARKDGVTKAGDRSSKARGKQRMSSEDSDTFRYQSPPTPPLF